MTGFRTIPPCPPNFAENFIDGGWRKIERIYGARTDCLLKWIEQCGGPELYARRRAAKAGVTAVKPRSSGE